MPFGGDDAESFYDEGLTASLRGDLSYAAKCFQRAIELDRTMTAAWHQLARCHLRVGQTDSAATILNRVLQENPQLAAPRVDLGHAMLGLGRHDEARRQFAQVLEADPQNARAKLGLGQLCFNEGDWPGAVAHAQEAVAGGESGYAAWFLLGRAAKLAGSTELSQDALAKAKAVIEKAFESDEHQLEGRFLQGEVAFTQEQFATALEHYRAAQDRADRGKIYAAFNETFTLVDILVKQALCYQRLGKTEFAIQASEHALKIDPNHELAKSLANLET